MLAQTPLGSCLGGEPYTRQKAPRILGPTRMQPPKQLHSFCLNGQTLQMKRKRK